MGFSWSCTIDEEIRDTKFWGKREQITLSEYSQLLLYVYGVTFSQLHIPYIYHKFENFHYKAVIIYR